VDQARKQRAPIPKAILEAPVLMPGSSFYYNAFLTLSSCRSMGMMEGRIPWTAVDAYARRYDLDDDDTDCLWTLVCSMDSVYLKHQQKRAKIATGGNKPTDKTEDRSQSPRIVHPPRKNRNGSASVR
jgi:hypothetical protein